MGFKRYQRFYYLGLCKEKKNPKILDYYGSGWVGPGLTRIFFLNHPKIANNQYLYFGVFCLCTLYIVKGC